MPRPSSDGAVPWPAEYAERYTARGYWEGVALGDRLHAAADAPPDAIAVVDGDRRLTYRRLAEHADAAAQRLAALGLRPDDRIVVQLPNTVEFVILTYACLRLGVIPVMALPGHRRHEIGHLVEHSEAVAIAVPDFLKDHDHQAMAFEIADGSPTLAHVLVLGDKVDDRAVDLGELCAGPAAPGARAAVDAYRPDSRSIAVFLLSGGTTGLPKLIARTHDDYLYNARRSAEVCELGPDTVYFAALPLGHNFPLACPGLLGTLLNGGRVVLGSPNPDKAFPLIEREGVTVSALVPAVAQRWLDHRADHPEADLSSLRLLQVGGSRLADHVARRVRPELDCTLQQVFGMAEGLLNYTRPDDPEDVICTTQGRPMCEDDELLVVDELGAPVAEGAAGVLLTRGPYTPRGYYRAEEQNARAFTEDGWYRTGDIVRLRADGNLVVEGRDKDMIIRGGENISAEEIENFAYQTPGVARAAAVAMPDDRLGERVCLYVVPEPGHTVTLDDVHHVMERAGCARFKFPERLVAVPELAATKVGKIDKKALRADIARRLDAEGTPR
ncbi:(2,3-dihydroxybenzoyl)adenylate synthase [Streptomyces ipomoeae]|jgi:2,3-dihydroxybenzoate-AMP ligase|uniref:(2,3-dihydroxybenzoyl)adenylate synthase n=2 Tax=Streptomyces ipomoeae TaxID=103232 RepID=A0AAE8VU65_9ACTN|nr:AMP-binding protein [Streptomyces ipomoeae]EKX61881.1 putative (2,3-dihydroxybenzoyl)adenylate synthase [Streptomyces ipomoeae 91-03]MDX2695194.1 AMP-binding protein [Streptomyces ipomoeae]MDX2822857.1 AMP-binding protein [Streptomyces ipomoeae]MDX2841182.1 AMP-binding protein [Streptomyces ipomoeae]TQE17831.1 (2,3-dihydroxybenzoyl)adenylate synthase [Streptomyces ipomoeae]